MTPERLQAAWLRRGVLAWALWPLAQLMGWAVRLRRLLYQAGVLRTHRVRVPVVVVGNVVAGGAGKTPVVLALVAHLQAQGVAAGVVSRGYGRRGGDCREVRADSTATEVGDEPLLIKQRTGVPVFVARRRADAARSLLQAHPHVRVIVSDDGLQHLGLARDLEICVFDDRGTGNGWLLPAGPLREPWPRPVDLVLQPGGVRGLAGYAMHRTLADRAVRADGSTQSCEQLKAQPVAALAGTARPQLFFAMLRDAGWTLKRSWALPDHAAFDTHAHTLRELDGPLVCTEKDAVKLWNWRPDAWAVPLVLTLDAAFWNAFDNWLVDNWLQPRLSSPDGAQTA